MSATTPGAARGAALEEPAPSGGFAIVERAATGGSMCPLHTRDETETYRVLEGALTVFVGDEAVAAAADDQVLVPGGVARTFRVESGRARWLVETRLASLARFEDFGRAVVRPTAGGSEGWPSAEEASALAAIARANGIELLGPPGRLP